MTDTRPAYWNGLPTTARHGTAVVDDTPEMPLHWAKTEGVNYGGGLRYLDDREGEGSAKVYGPVAGGPRAGHKEVDIVPGSFIDDSSPVEATSDIETGATE